MSALNAFAQSNVNGNRTYGEALHIVTVYVIEPHPEAPDISPYFGVSYEVDYTDRGQPQTYGDRVAAALDLEDLLVPEVKVLVDELGPGGSNPVWCTYGTCPNCTFVIDRSRRLHAVSSWQDMTDLQAAVDELL